MLGLSSQYVKLTRLALFTVTVSAGCAALAQPVPGCGDLRELGQEQDYRRAAKREKDLVERNHFTPAVEALISGAQGLLNQDIAYTLRWFPNHHRALVSLTKLAERNRWAPLPDMKYSVDCYFRRATQLAPDDGIARMLYATYLFKVNRVDEALAQTDRSVMLADDSALSHYNIGLVLVEQQQYERALQQAQRAMALGYNRTELKQRLVAAGQWRDAPEPAEGSVTPSPAASATK